MSVVVTGGDGFIGQRVCHFLRSVGEDVVSLDRSHGHDVTDPMTWPVMEPTAFIHLAGVLGTEELFDAPHKAVDVNVKGTLNVLQRAAQVGATYVGITMPSVWRNVYQATKRCAFDLAQAWAESYSLKIAHVRAFNVYGPGQKVYGVQKIIPTFATRAWRNDPIPIWGSGRQTVDLVHVDAVAEMLVRAISHADAEWPPVFDAGVGVGVEVIDVAQAILKHTDSKGGIQNLPMRKGETISTKIVATGAGWEQLGYAPRFDWAPVMKAVDWYRDIRP